MFVRGICLAICISLSSGQNSDIITEVYKCFTDQGIDIPLQSDQTAETIFKQANVFDTSDYCTDITKYKNALGCVMTLLKTILNPVGLSGIVPDNQSLNQGMDYLCNNLNNIDVACFFENFPRVKQCGLTLANTFGQSYRGDVSRMIDTITCWSYDMTYDCISVHMTSCPKSTAQIMLNLVDKYLLPSTCKNPSRPNRQSYT